MRNRNIDGLRLIAAVGIISLHSGVYAEAPLAGDIVTSIFRWAVPVFFMITGFYLARDESALPDMTVSTISKPLVLFALYTCLYLPLFIARFGVGSIGLDLLIRGADIHLWYLTALPIALIALAVFKTSISDRGIVLISAGILGLYIVANVMWVSTHKGYGLVMVLRELMGIPCVFAGMKMRHWTFGPRTYWKVLLGGCLVMFVEIVIIRLGGERAVNMQFGLSTLPIAVGLLGLMITSRDLFPTFVSDLGQSESAGIYVFHRLFMVVAASLVAMKPKLTFEDVPSLPLWGLTTVLTVGGLVALSAISPRVRRWADGRY